MSTYRELVYLILDEVKGNSDDYNYTEDHIIFLLSKYRSFLLKQRYSDIKKTIPDSNYQTLCLNLMEVPAICGEPCEGGVYLRSTNKIPYLIEIGTPRIYPYNYFIGEMAYISRDRMRYIGYNRFLKNIVYGTIGPDQYLYLKSTNPQFLHLEKINFTGVFQDSTEASYLSCNLEETCDILDLSFPIEESLVPPLIELIGKELIKSAYIPVDSDNNSKDDVDLSRSKQE